MNTNHRNYLRIRDETRLADNVREWIEQMPNTPEAPYPDDAEIETFFHAAVLLVGDLDPDDGEALNTFIDFRRQCFPGRHLFAIVHPLSIQSYRAWFEAHRRKP